MKVASVIKPAYASKTRLAGDKDACAVIAVANAFNISSHEATSLCAIHGRQHGKGMRLDYMHDLVKRLRGRLVGVFGTTNAAVWLSKQIKNRGDDVFHYKGMTLQKFMQAHPNGVYLLSVTGHFTVIKDGKLCDVGELSGAMSVTGAWKVD